MAGSGTILSNLEENMGMCGLHLFGFPSHPLSQVDDDIRTTNESLRIISESGKAIVAEKKLAYQAAQVDGTEGKDLLSLLSKPLLPLCLTHTQKSTLLSQI